MFVLAVHSERFKRKRKKDSPPKGFIGPMRKHRKDVSVMDMRQFTIALTLCLSCQAFLVRGVPQLIQIQVVTRHGARTVLTKQAATLAEGGSSLTSKGERQLNKIGEELRAEYMTQDSRLKNLKVYEANKVWLQSSNMDRTIASSMSLAEGIWPETADESMYPNNISKQIPVHSVGSGKNDVTIRSYANCPTFHTRLEKLYSSKSFVKKEQDNLDFLRVLKTKFPSLTGRGSSGSTLDYVQLRNVWNIFDAINVAKDLQPHSAMATKLTLDQFTKLKELTAWVEHNRFSADVAGILIGSNLWREMFNRMESLYLFNADSSKENTTFQDIFETNTLPAGALHPPHQFIHYSAHYPTILGLFSALNLFEKNSFLKYESNKDVSAIPNYGAALILEVWKATQTNLVSTKAIEDSIYLRLRYKDGDSVATNSSPYVEFGDECTAASEKLGFPIKSCPIAKFKELLNKQIFTNYGGWCYACENFESQVCLLENAKELRSKCNTSGTSLSGIGGLIIGAIMGIFFSFACVFTGLCDGIVKKCCRRHERYQLHETTTELPANHNSL